SQDAFRVGNRELIVLPARTKRAIDIAVTGGRVDYTKSATLQLRFDGVSVGKVRVRVPAMALGQPPNRAVTARTPSSPVVANASASPEKHDGEKGSAPAPAPT